MRKKKLLVETHLRVKSLRAASSEFSQPATLNAQLYSVRWFAIIVFFSLVALNVIGCSSLSIARQKKMAMLMGQQIGFIGDEVVAACNDGTLKPEDCNIIGDSVNLALDAQNAYARALVAMQEGSGSADQAQKALTALQSNMAVLIGNAIRLGIKIRVER